MKLDWTQLVLIVLGTTCMGFMAGATIEPFCEQPKTTAQPVVQAVAIPRPTAVAIPCPMEWVGPRPYIYGTQYWYVCTDTGRVYGEIRQAFPKSDTRWDVFVNGASYGPMMTLEQAKFQTERVYKSKE